MSNFSAFVIMYNRRIIICTLKSFMNDRLQLSLDGYDIFNMNKVRSGARLNDIIMNSISKEDTRKIGITVTYRFRTERTMNNRSAAENEMSRLNMDSQ